MLGGRCCLQGLPPEATQVGPSHCRAYRVTPFGAELRGQCFWTLVKHCLSGGGGSLSKLRRRAAWPLPGTQDMADRRSPFPSLRTKPGGLHRHFPHTQPLKHFQPHTHPEEVRR